MKNWLSKIFVLLFLNITSTTSHATDDLDPESIETVMHSFYETVREEFSGTTLFEPRKASLAFFCTLALLEYFMDNAINCGYSAIGRPGVNPERPPTYFVCQALKEAMGASPHHCFGYFLGSLKRYEALYYRTTLAINSASCTGNRAAKAAVQNFVEGMRYDELGTGYRVADLELFKFLKHNALELLDISKRRTLSWTLCLDFINPMQSQELWNAFRQKYFSRLDKRSLIYIHPLLFMMEDALVKKSTALSLIQAHMREGNTFSELPLDIYKYILSLIIFYYDLPLLAPPASQMD